MTDIKKLRELAEDFERKLSSDCGIQEAIESGALFHDAANPQAIIEILDRLERYEKALRFYGNEKNWDDSFLLSMSDREPTTIHDECGGKRAREALEGGK